MVKKFDDIDPDGVRIIIPWSQLYEGCSFFVPCINTARAESQIKKIGDRLGYSLICRVRNENQVLGLRIWRIA